MDNLRANKKKFLKKNNSDLYLQILDWSANDQEVDKESESDSDSDSGKYKPKKYRYFIQLFCNTIEGNSISVKVIGFPPYLYVNVPDTWGKTEMKKFVNSVKDKLGTTNGNSLVNYSLQKKKKFKGFTNNKLFNYIRLVFSSNKAKRACQYLLQKSFRCPAISAKAMKFVVYEANIDPMLRFSHIQDLQPAGWIKIAADTYSVNKPKETHCQADISVKWEDIKPHDSNDMCPFIIGGFDIECYSSHGDFPLAIKDYKKLAANIADTYDNLSKELSKQRELKNKELVQKYSNILRDDELLKSVLEQLILMAFPDNELQKKPQGEINIPIDLDLIYTKGFKKPSSKEVEICVNEFLEILKNVIGKENKRDIRINKIKDVMNIHFPEVEGDELIQIGTTLQYYGKSECFLKHIITLGSCEPIEGAIVESYETEKEVLIAWSNLIRKVDPDILLGWNIWGFDLEYLYLRARENNCVEQFAYLGRIKGLKSELEQKELSSAGLGDNILKLVNMTGRIVFDLMKYVQNNFNLDSYKLDSVAYHFNKEKKLDVSPQEIFDLQKGNSQDRCKIAKYCIVDCELCNRLCKKLECIANNVGMANVCSVPLSFIFTRGQGIKILSLVAKRCRLENFLIPPPAKKYTGEEDISDLEGYEGAIVLKPYPGIYLDKPIAVVDYGSLYPSSMIAENLSHDSIVLEPEYDNLPGYTYVDVTYDNYMYIQKGAAIKKIINKDEPTKTCRFAQFPNDEKAIIPKILEDLLAARKSTRKKIPLEPDPFKKSVLDGLQSAFKITANSLYGQIGARTSQIYMKDIAASTTATGRNMLHLAKDYVEENYEGSKIVYGDTDSIFIDFHPKDTLGNRLTGREGLIESIRLGKEVEVNIQSLLKKPHKLEYEKCFWPFMLISKKRYVGRKFEEDPDKSYINSMGVVSKRRDNAKIVKHIYGGILDIIMNKYDIELSKKFLREELLKLANGEFPLEELIITKSLRGYYKDPDRIAHKVLADRIGERDPGNKPGSNDRIPYIYIEKKESRTRVILQGERIENPDFIKENKLRPDYRFYITNQIKKPVSQIYALVMDNPDKLFEESLRLIDNNRNRVKPITSWFTQVNPNDITSL